MSHTHRLITLALAGILAAGVAASGCATPWFGTDAKNAQPQAASAQLTDPKMDPKQATIAYINGLCKLPKEQHDSLARELNEALLPNHATISCGPGGGS